MRGGGFSIQKLHTKQTYKMNADCKGALAQINQSYKSFVHNGNKMSKQAVKKVLEYAVAKGYEHTGQISDAEIDSILTPGTTREQWERYYIERNAHERHCNIIKPNQENFDSYQEYITAYNEWCRKLHMDAPNKPGYFRSNND